MYTEYLEKAKIWLNTVSYFGLKNWQWLAFPSIVVAGVIIYLFGNKSNNKAIIKK